jgi:hypothetical protein
MRGLTKFVGEYKDFMKWLNGKNKDPNEYVRQFEQIFSVTTETELLREIQDMKDELNMLSAVFNDQRSVLKKVGENIESNRKSLLAKSKDNSTSKPNHASPSDHLKDGNEVHLVEASLSVFTFQQQSHKHMGHIKRMQDQANQAYRNVSIRLMPHNRANTYSDQLQDLLNLKQQQANVLEARVNRNQSIIAKEQNKTIMVFTIVTIIFVSRAQGIG